eukprot:6431211-Lingulodinium_polyedra.AAC.1
MDHVARANPEPLQTNGPAMRGESPLCRLQGAPLLYIRLEMGRAVVLLPPETIVPQHLSRADTRLNSPVAKW